MYRLLCVLVLLGSVCPLARRAPPPAARPGPRSRSLLRVYKGYPDTAGRFPYVVALVIGDWRICTGTLISPNWVITASHCIANGSPTHIQYGNMSQAPYESTTKSRILNILVYLGYRDYEPYQDYIRNDIGLLKVEPVYLRAFGNISAVDYRSMTGRAVQYAGYGDTYNRNTENRRNVSIMDESRPLQWGEGVVVACDERQYICVAPKCSNPEQNTMPGDSGSALFHDNKIIGILMGGDDTPPISLFTGVSSYLSWINSEMSK